MEILSNTLLEQHFILKTLGYIHHPEIPGHVLLFAANTNYVSKMEFFFFFREEI